MSIEDLIRIRQGTHGVFKENTVFIQAVKDLMRQQPNWSKMAPYQKEALEMIVHKLGRILHGDPDFEEHYVDIAGYAQRVAKTLREGP